jgi:phosphohistidine phosphatase
MRHAKSDWSADYPVDHERPLNPRGVRSARAIGEALTARGLDPDLVITSSAVRARTTAELARDAGSWRGAIVLEPRLYDADPSVVIEVAASAPDVDRLMLVGHQPTWSATVHALTAHVVDMKTATVAVIEVAIDEWAHLPGGSGNLVQVLHPRRSR